MKTDDHSDSGKAIAKNASCKSPIIVGRTGLDCADLSFSLECFDAFTIDFTVHGCGFGDDRWEIVASSQSKHQGHMTYCIKLSRPKADYDNGIVLRSVTSNIAMKVYIKDVRAWDAKVKVSDLAKTGDILSALRNANSADILRILQYAGIADTAQLGRLTREELCRFKGMTTEAGASIERSLAARLLFLNTAAIAAWNENE